MINVKINIGYRMDIDEYYLGIAEAVSRRSPCLRENYGAVIVKNDRIVSVGYNAPATGVEHCKKCARNEKEHGKDYGSKCLAIHSEENAVINAGREKCLGAILYLWGTRPAEPCYRCMRVLKNVGIKKIITNK